MQCKAGLDALLEERGAAEQAFTDAHAASLGASEEQLDAAHTADQDAYHALRTRWGAVAACHPLLLTQALRTFNEHVVCKGFGSSKEHMLMFLLHGKPHNRVQHGARLRCGSPDESLCTTIRSPGVPLRARLDAQIQALALARLRARRQLAFHTVPLRARLDAQIQGMELALARLRARDQLARDQLDYSLATVAVRTAET